MIRRTFSTIRDSINLRRIINNPDDIAKMPSDERRNHFYDVFFACHMRARNDFLRESTNKQLKKVVYKRNIHFIIARYFELGLPIEMIQNTEMANEITKFKKCNMWSYESVKKFIEKNNLSPHYSVYFELCKNLSDDNIKEIIKK